MSLVKSPTIATYPSVGRRGEKPKERLPKKKTRGSRHQGLFQENVKKTKKQGRRSTNFENEGSRVVYAQGRY